MAASWFLSFLYSKFLATLPYPTTSFQRQTIIVTGSNTGLGLEAARHFARLNASKVILAVRNTSKGEAAKSSILSSLPHISPETIEVWALDLSSFASVRAFAEKANGLQRVDAVLENAGIGTNFWKGMEGMESTITTNVISTELLALFLLPKLRETAIRYTVVPRSPLCGTDENRYGVSKLLEVFFVRELAKKIDDSKKPKVIFNCITPGACKSDFFRELKGLNALFMDFMKFIIARSTEAGSRTLVAGIAAGEESHGHYMADCKVARPSPLVMSGEGAELQKKLWDQTMKILEEIQPGIEKNI